MAGARHEPHSGGSPRLGNPGKPDNLKPLLCDLPTPREKVKEHTNMSRTCTPGLWLLDYPVTKTQGR